MKIREENLIEVAGVVGKDAIELQAIARALHRLCECTCNYGLTDRQEKRQDKLEARAKEIASQHGLVGYY